MTRWHRATLPTECGNCSGVIAAGDPVFEYVRWKRLRCATCAGEPVPAELPALEAPRVTLTPRNVNPGIARSPSEQMAQLAANYKRSLPWRSATYPQRVAQIQTIKQVLKDMKLSAAGQD